MLFPHPRKPPDDVAIFLHNHALFNYRNTFAGDLHEALFFPLEMLQTRSLHAPPGGMEIDLNRSWGFDLFVSPSWFSLSLHLFFAATANLSLASIAVNSNARSANSAPDLHCD